MAAVSPDELHHRYLQTCAAPDAGPQPGASLFVQMLTAMGLTPDQAADLRRRMSWDGVALTPYDDALPALRRLHEAGLRLGVLANQPASAQDDLRQANLLPLLDGVWLSDAVGLSKPAPAFFQLAIDAWNLPPQRIAYVGDRPDNDVRPAKALSMHTVLLKVGPHACQSPNGAAETPDFTAATLLDAAHHLLRWARGED